MGRNPTPSSIERLKELPFYKIEMHIPTLYDNADEYVDFILYDDELIINRKGAPEEREKGLCALLEVDLAFNIKSAIKLRDFLNFALPDLNDDA